MDLDGTLCYCFHIKKRKIVNFVKQTRPRRASQISECFGAGTGCGWCVPFLKRIHRQIMAGEAVEADDIGTAEYEEMRRRYREALARGEPDPRDPSILGATEPEIPAEHSLPSAERSSKRDDDWDVTDYFLKRSRRSGEDTD